MRTEPVSPGLIGKMMYAAIAATLPSIDRPNSRPTRRELAASFFGSSSETRGRNGGNPGFSTPVGRHDRRVPGDTLASYFSTSVPWSAPWSAIAFPFRWCSVSWTWRSATR